MKLTLSSVTRRNQGASEPAPLPQRAQTTTLQRRTWDDWSLEFSQLPEEQLGKILSDLRRWKSEQGSIFFHFHLAKLLAIVEKIQDERRNNE